MKTLCGFGLLLLAAGALEAQNRSGFVNPGGIIRRSVPSVVQPAGTSALPGVQRTTPNVVYTAGGLSIGIPVTVQVRPNVGRPGGVRFFGNRGFDKGGFDRGFDKGGFDRGFDKGGFAYPVYLGGYGA